MPGRSQRLLFDQRYVDAGDVRLHVAQVPGERPLVMLHGIGMDWRVWQAVSRRLVPRYGLYLVDLRGHGLSNKPEHGYSIAHYAADVEELVDALGLQNALLVGSSLGGVVAAATELPLDMVSHKVLVDAPLTGGPVRDAEGFRTILRLKGEETAKLGAYLQRTNPGVGSFLARKMSEMWHEASNGVIEDMLAHASDYFDIAPALRATEQPTLLLQADAARGGVLRDEDIEQTLNLLPRGSVREIQGAGHAIHATHPAEFVAALDSFSESVFIPAPLQLRDAREGQHAP
jgi:2-(acetamidomethylene)succinate hydrolase